MARLETQLTNEMLEISSVENPLLVVVDMINGFVNAVYSLNVVWSAESFEYDSSAVVWSPDELDYVAAEGGAAGWVNDEIVVTITNKSNAAVKASIAVNDLNANDGMTVSAVEGEATLASSVAEGPSTADLKLKVDGAPGEDVTEAEVVTATVSFQAA